MGYSPSQYIHDLDRKAFDALNLFPQLVQLQQAWLANVDEKTERIRLLSSAIRLGERQLPEVWQLLPPICEKLGIAVPELYMVNGKEPNAFTGGAASPYLCVTSALVKQLPPQMIASVLAHECGHIACGHSLYHTLAGHLVDGVEASPLGRIPAVRRYLSSGLVRALLFWYRCSELSADRAALLCDGDAGITVDTLLRIHGYDETVNREAFLQQAVDLKSFVDESTANQMIEQMVVQWDTHPMLARRVCECYEWGRSEQFQLILHGATQGTEDCLEQAEILSAQVSAANVSNRAQETLTALDARLQGLDAELERFTVSDNKAVYPYAIACGILSSWVDSMFFSDITIAGNDLAFSHRQVNHFIQEYAKSRGIGRDRLQDAIRELEKAFPVAQDNIWKGKNIKVGAKNHHLADLAHHPTPVGLLASLAVQFLRVGIFVNRDGEWHFLLVETKAEDVVRIAVPAVITGVLNWLVSIAERKYEEAAGQELPRAIHRLAHLLASTPELVELARAADLWFGHLVSDMGGSKQTAGGGMGIPGVFLSMLYELAALPPFKGTGLTAVLNDLYTKQKFDLRHELALGEQVKRQAIPVLFHEIIVRVGYMLIRLEDELLEHHSLKGVNWRSVIPVANRTIDRMLTVSTLTFSVVDTADAAVRAALESGGSWVLFAGRFRARFNYVGAGRAAVAIVREISNERREAQLLHERMLLMDAKTALVYARLQDYKARLNEALTAYLAEDITAYLEGFGQMEEGLKTGDSDLVIRGNVTIQRVLGRAPQFTTQQEFDDLMESDAPLLL